MFLVSNKALSLEILPGPYSWPKMYKRLRWWGGGGGGCGAESSKKKTSVTRPSIEQSLKNICFFAISNFLKEGVKQCQKSRLQMF